MAARYGQLEVLSFLCKMGIALDTQDKVSIYYVATKLLHVYSIEALGMLFVIIVTS